MSEVPKIPFAGHVFNLFVNGFYERVATQLDGRLVPDAVREYEDKLQPFFENSEVQLNTEPLVIESAGMRMALAALDVRTQRHSNRLFVFFGCIFAFVGSMMIVVMLVNNGFRMPALTGDTLGGFAIGAGIFAVGSTIMFFSLRFGARFKRLLRHGTDMTAVIMGNPEDTGVQVNKAPIYRLLLRYTVAGATRETICKISGDTVERARRLVADRKVARILCDLNNPDCILYTDSLLQVSPELEP